MKNEAEIELYMTAWEFTDNEKKLVREALSAGFIGTANSFLETIVEHKKEDERNRYELENP